MVSICPCLHGLYTEATLCLLRVAADEQLSHHLAKGPSQDRQAWVKGYSNAGRVNASIYITIY